MAWGRENATSGLTSILNGFRAGQDRARNWDKEVADRKQKAAEFNAQHDPYEEATTDDRGLPNGMKQRDDYYDRDAAVNEPLSPHFFHGQEQMPDKPVPPPPAPPAAPAPGPGAQGADGPTAENDPQILASRAANRAMGIDPTKMDANRHPDSGVGKPELAPGDPKPLLRDPKAVLAEQQHGHTQDQAEAQRQAEAVTLEGGQKAMLERGADWAEVDPNAPKHYMGRDPKTGKDQYQVNASRVGVNIPEGASIKGDGGEEAAAAGLPSQAPAGAAPAPPGNAPAPASLRPSPYMMKRITDLNTMMPRAGQRMVDVNELSPDMQERLGVTDEMRQNHTKLPSDLVTKYMIGDQRLDAAAMRGQAIGANKEISPEAVPFVRGIEEGKTSVAQAMSSFHDAYGRMPTPAEIKSFGDANGRRMGGSRLDMQGDRLDLSKERFGFTKDKSSAQVSGHYAEQALKDTKPDLEALHTLDTVESMLKRKDTNGLRKLVPIIIERGFVPQRLTNQMIGADTGLTGVGSIADQLVEGLDSGRLTKENVGFFLSLVHEARQEHSSQYSNKTARWFRAGVGALQAQGVPEEDAVVMMRKELAPEVQMKRSAPVSGEFPDSMAGAATKYGEKSGFKQSKGEAGLHKLMQDATAKMKEIDASEKLNPSEKRGYKQKVMDAFKKRSGGIEWKAPGGSH